MTREEDVSDLEERVAEILLLPETEQANAFRVLREEHPDRSELLRRWEAELRNVPSPESATSVSRPMDDIGRQIGPYEVLEVLGEGGMGTVYIAEQREPVQRRVALKVIKLGMDSKAIIARFEQERQALAVMSHDSIAQVYDGGTTDRGQPWFAMEFVDGMPLTRYCDDNRLSVVQRIELFGKVCAGVQHAHQKGVIHRDLKPGNILVSRRGDEHVPKIIDFGIARATAGRLGAETIHTEVGTLVGTPEYMSPEQASRDSTQIDTRTDIYSLGVILYELLVGQLPFSSAQLRAASPIEVLRILREIEPPRPSTRTTAHGGEVGDAAERRSTTVTGLRNQVRGDLDWIVLRALAKEPERRYESANGLRADLQRFLAFEPVSAGPPSAWYRIRKYVRRHRVSVAAVAAVLVTAVGGGLAALKYAIDAEDNARTATHNEQIADARAEENAALAAKLLTKVQQFNQVSAVVQHDLLVTGVEHLFPAWPDKIGVIEQWRAFGAELLVMRAEITETVTELRTRALPPSEGVGDERTWKFPVETEAGAIDGFLHDTLTTLLDELTVLEHETRPLVDGLLAWARQVAQLTRAHPGASITWAEAREGVRASPRYADLEIELAFDDVLGLVPIGANPVTGYWEFYHLRSAWDGESNPADLPIPVHRADGKIEVGESTGIVFVLLPGGTFAMGAQRDDPDAPNYDPDGWRTSGWPVHEVPLAPFFVAKHEMTQGQWARLWFGREEMRHPSHHPAGSTPGKLHTMTLAHPVERVDWWSCDATLRHHGLLLPTEAQWEYGCRAGTTGKWFCEQADLPRHDNLSDRTAAVTGWKHESWEDGHIVHAPVGSFASNPFGLHDMHGNVSEWCRDGFGNYRSPCQPGTGLRLIRDPRMRVLRGGSFSMLSSLAGCALRLRNAPEDRRVDVGLRATRVLRR